MKSEKIIGIDLGTTYSCVAYIDEIGKPVVLPNSDGEFTTPSAVHFENQTNIIVGRQAKNSSKVDPDRVAEYFKRSMGDPSFSFTVDGTEYRPEEISAYVLRKLVQDASQSLGEEITDVIITCPAYFGVNEREATKNAGAIANLNVRHILNEPTAAAIFYGLNRAQKDQVVLVYDLGGGTFDITVIALQGGNINVVVTGGNYYLGGKNWDDQITEYFASEFSIAHPEQGSPLDNPYSYQDVLKEAEQAKISLTTKEKYKSPVLHGGERALVELTREKFEELTSDLLEQTITLTRNVIEEAKQKGYPRIDQIILVGGSSKMPSVSRRIKEEFGLEPQLLEPDLAVAKGAALMGLKILAGEKIIDEVAAQQGISKDEVDLEKVDEQVLKQAAQSAAGKVGTLFRLPGKDLLEMAKRQITNVCSKGFGVVVKDEANGQPFVAFLIHKNTTLPAESTQEFGTEVSNQVNVEIRVMEQAAETESPDVADNNQIGDGLLVGFPTNLPVGSPIQITFRLEEDGTLQVTGLEPSSKTNLHFEVKVQEGVMSQQEVQEKRGLLLKQTVS
jgi:molecular chaperone DnaK